MSDRRTKTRNKPLVATLREEYVKLTGDPIAALVLNQMMYWSERVADFDDFIEEERERDPEVNIELTSGWVYKSAKQLEGELMGIAKRPTIARRLSDLVERGWLLSRRNPRHGWDKTLQYRPDLHKLSRDLAKLGYAIPGYRIDLSEASSAHREHLSAHSEHSSDHSEQAIPETTTETTTDISRAARENTDCDTSLSPPSDEPPLFPTEPLSPPTYPSKEERVARLRANRDARAAAAWAEGLPDPLWGEHSSVVERALKDPSIDAGGIRRLGRFLESELRIQVPWSSARLLKTWVAGLKDLHAVVGNDTDLVRDAYAHLKRERLPIANPHALVKMAQHFANERAAKREPGAVTLTEEQIRASLQNIITW